MGVQIVWAQKSPIGYTKARDPTEKIQKMNIPIFGFGQITGFR